jgi:hypothetical protein
MLRLAVEPDQRCGPISQPPWSWYNQPMKPMRRKLVLAATLSMILSGCAHISGKTVARKDPPNILIADDGSMCVVSADRWEKTEVGMKALCGWRGGRLPGTGPANGN